MAFPSTSILDSGTHANGGLTASWTTHSGVGGSSLNYASNTIISLSGYAAAYWNASTLTDCEAYATIGSVGAAATNSVVWARLQATPTVSGYCIATGSAAGKVSLFKCTNNTFTDLVTAFTYTAQVGDKIGINVVGTTVTGWLFSSGAWSQILQGTDATYASGYIGLETDITTSGAGFTNFGGGAVSSGATSGSASGGVNFPTAFLINNSH